MTLEQLWNGWRAQYIASAQIGSSRAVASVFTQILKSGLSDVDSNIVHRGEKVFAILNAFPYSTGHVLVLPYREVSDLEDLDAAESAELWATVTQSVRAIKVSHQPHAVNVGLNLGAAAGGSISEHLHVHVVPRWNGDSNFMTSVANTRTLPEPLADTAHKIRAAWSD
ncbi:MAG: HIT domain-containing protein [Ilumatobacteraceae bacterium]|nr:HIT domain-containing protein [Ilumatobacteraceae bacterium]